MGKPANISQLIKNKALELGFNAVGISKAEALKGFNFVLREWLKSNYHAEMSYMERNCEKRCDPRLLVENAKSVISLLISYYPNKEQDKSIPQIAKYAYGIDYHFVLKDKMQELWNFIKEAHSDLSGRMFVDSAPVADKLWAVNAGLGWIGKNSCLINRGIGSFTFICELIINIELEYDEPYRSNFCGSCTKCIDACPTKAIVKPGVIDSNRCISYLTIENKNHTIPNDFEGKFQNRLFGCDICQDVCPWNKEPLLTKVKAFNAVPEIYKFDTVAWAELDKERFNKIFKNSALKRSKFQGIIRNFDFIKEKPKTQQ